MNNKILSVSELEDIDTEIDWVKEDLEGGIRDIKTIISSFNNQEIVSSFYASGKYGDDIKEKLETILKALTDFANTVESENGLINQSKKYVQKQIELNTTGATK